MIDIQLVTQTGLMLLVVLLIGYLSEKIGFINKDFTQTLSRFTMCVAQPCLLFSSVAGAAYSKSLIKQGGLVLLLAFGAHAVMAIMAKGAALVYPDREERKISEFSLLFVNCAFVGYPLLDAAFGEIGLFRGAFWVTAFNLIIWTWGIFLLSRGRTDIPFSLRRVILNYGTVPCLLGLLVYLLRIPIPSVVLDGMEAVGGLCTPGCAAHHRRQFGTDPTAQIIWRMENLLFFRHASIGFSIDGGAFVPPLRLVRHLVSVCLYYDSSADSRQTPSCLQKCMISVRMRRRKPWV